MKNPWTKKNPFMSMWLSGANAIAGKARGQATAAAKAQTNAAVKQGMAGWLGAITKAMQPATPPPAAAPVRKSAAKPARKTGAAAKTRRRKAAR